MDSENSSGQADLSLRWAHTHFVGFVMSLLVSCKANSSFDFLLACWQQTHAYAMSMKVQNHTISP